MWTLQQADEQDRVIREILAHSGQIGAHVDAELAQMLAGADA